MTSDFFSIVDEEGKEINGWAHFHDVFMISALTGDGVDVLQVRLLSNTTI